MIGIPLLLASDRLHLASWFGNVAPAFAHRNYRIYVSGNAVGLIGTWLQRVSVGWLAWTLTHSGVPRALRRGRGLVTGVVPRSDRDRRFRGAPKQEPRARSAALP